MSEDEQPPAWFTDAQRGGFEVGDRVRIRLTGEYPLVKLKRGGEIAAHQPAEDGRTGTINDIIEDDAACLYQVHFDAPFAPMPSVPRVTIERWLYTAAELEPLDDDPDRRAIPYVYPTKREPYR